MMPGAGGDVNTTLPLILGILSTLCCGTGIPLVLGIVAIIFSVQAKNLKSQGQIDQARSKAKTATLLGAIGIGLGLVLGTIVGILQFAAASR
jgi:hypothetical protein